MTSVKFNERHAKKDNVDVSSPFPEEIDFEWGMDLYDDFGDNEVMLRVGKFNEPDTETVGSVVSVGQVNENIVSVVIESFLEKKWHRHLRHQQ